jgi:hypothetical protein
MRITRDECRLFAELLPDLIDDGFNERLLAQHNLVMEDYFNAIKNMIAKFEDASSDGRRKSDRVISNDYFDLMIRLTKKYKNG